MTDSFKFDAAFSFLDSDAALVAEITKSMRAGLNVFVYSEQQAALVGNDGADMFSDVFSRDARIVVVLYREQWGRTKWTRIEEAAIKNRLLNDGPNFLTFIHLDKGKPTPSWLPQTRIWLDLDRLGAAGAAAIIEERIANAGGVVREESVEENATRLRSEQEWSAKRLAFLNSNAGVDAANKAAQALFDRIEALSKVAECAVARESWGVQLYRKGYAVLVAWHNEYLNTLNESTLRVEDWSGRPDFGRYRYSHFSHKPSQLAEEKHEFDILPSGDQAWRRTGGGAFLTTERLSDNAVKRLLELVRRDGGQRGGWA